MPTKLTCPLCGARKDPLSLSGWGACSTCKADAKAVIDAAFKRALHAALRDAEQEAAYIVYRTLRPRLRWAAKRPRAVRLLRNLRVWTPPRYITTSVRLPPQADRVVIDIVKRPL